MQESGQAICWTHDVLGGLLTQVFSSAPQMSCHSIIDNVCFEYEGGFRDRNFPEIGITAQLGLRLYVLVRLTCTRTSLTASCALGGVFELSLPSSVDFQSDFCPCVSVCLGSQRDCRVTSNRHRRSPHTVTFRLQHFQFDQSASMQEERNCKRAKSWDPADTRLFNQERMVGKTCTQREIPLDFSEADPEVGDLVVVSCCHGCARESSTKHVLDEKTILY